MPKSALLQTYETALKNLREICLELPEATESVKWGKPHFCVANKIFCGCREEDGRIVIGFLLEMGHAQQIVEDPRFWLVGTKGGVCMDVSKVKNWQEVKALVRESYYLMAPKKLTGKSIETKETTRVEKPKQRLKSKTLTK